MRLCLVSPFVEHPPHASILDPPSSFAPAGCSVTCICTASASQHAATSQLAVLLSSTLMSVAIVVISRHTIAIVVDFVACCVVAIVTVMLF